MLLTHEALPIKLKNSGRNAEKPPVVNSRLPGHAQSLKATEPTGFFRSVYYA
jgi:hypothetical protein